MKLDKHKLINILVTKGYSYKTFSEKLKVSRVSVWNIFKGEEKYKDVSILKANKIINALGCTIEDIEFREGDE